MSAERRLGNRLRLHCAIQLFRVDGHAISAETDDLSINGFYCTSDEPFSPGERLECEILIPGQANAVRGEALAMHCKVKVLRVEINGLEPGFGIACQFEDRRMAVI